MSTDAATVSDTGPGPAAGSGDATAGRTGAAVWVAESAKAIADPAPLGLAGFALTTFLLSLVNAGILPDSTLVMVLGLALAYGGIGQFVAGVWEFRKGNTFGSTAFCSYGAFWVSFWAFVAFYLPHIPKADQPAALGWYLVAWGFFTTIMFLASFRTTTALVVLFALLAATYYVLGIGELTGTHGLHTFGGWLGIATAAVAWYTAMAGVLSATFGKPVLPNPPMRRL